MTVTPKKKKRKEKEKERKARHYHIQREKSLGRAPDGESRPRRLEALYPNRAVTQHDPKTGKKTERLRRPHRRSSGPRAAQPLGAWTRSSPAPGRAPGPGRAQLSSAQLNSPHGPSQPPLRAFPRSRPRRGRALLRQRAVRTRGGAASGGGRAGRQTAGWRRRARPGPLGGG